MPSIPMIMLRSVGATNSSAYVEGLAGVDQVANFTFINTSVIFFAVLCAICLIYRLITIANNHLRQSITTGASLERHTYFSRNQTNFWPRIKRHIVYAPLWRKRHNQGIQLSSSVSIGTLPARLSTIIISLYLLSNVIFCLFLDYSSSNRESTIAELRGRAGALATFNLIPTILFALRNNPLIPILHISYDTFNLFHRWIARILIVESIVHVSAWAANAVAADGVHHLYTLLLGSTSFQWGTVGAVSLIIIAIQAWSPLRHAFYESFLNIHRILIMLTLIGIYIHLDKARLPQLPYVLLCFILWVGEWLIRSARIIYSNLKLSGKQTTTAVVEALDSGVSRVTFNLAIPLDIQPGAHVHIYIPAVGLWSSHPFSVAWTSPSPAHGFSNIEKRASSSSASSQLSSTSTICAPPSPKMPTSSPTQGQRQTISCLIRSRGGMTRALHALASSSLNRTSTLHALVEGPYGTSHSLDSYGTILLFAGGVGITHQLLYIRHLLLGAVANTCAAKKIILVWSITHREHLEWVRPWMDEILALPRRAEYLTMYNYVTRDAGVQMCSPSGTVHVIPGRCDVEGVVDREFEERVGAMAISVCGPGGFADDVRDATRKRVMEGSVEFLEEAFTY